MKGRNRASYFLLIITFSFAQISCDRKQQSGPTVQESRTVKVKIETSMGNMIVELYPDKAPITVENFLKYVDRKFYDGTIFHRIERGVVIQGGGYTEDLREKRADKPIKNEAKNGLKNERGTIAMARTSAIDSATCQFFINLRDNQQWNHINDQQWGYGYAVFGKIVDGLEVIDKIGNTPVTTRGGMANVPINPVFIISIRRVE